MPVVIQLDDGNIREYPVSPSSPGSASTKCGKSECDHLECAIDFAEHIVWLGPRLIGIGWLGLFLVVGYSILSSDLPHSLQDMLVLLGLGLALTAFVLVIWYNNKKNLKELLEFREHHTIHDVPARQIYDDPNADEEYRELFQE
jgi:hypothetical protein